MKIVIDARESGTSTGRYIDKLVEHMHTLGPTHDITVLAKTHRLDFMQKLVPNFTVVETPHKEFTFGEQLGFKKQIESLKPDLVHFGMVQQPVYYRGKTVTTMNDLTTARFRNPTKNAIAFTLKQQIYKWVNKKVAKKATQIITYTNFVKQDIVQYTKVSPDKITTTYLSADKISDSPEIFEAAQGKRFLLYVGRPQPHKNLQRLIDAYALAKQENPELHLVLAGKFDQAYQLLKEYAEKQEITDIVFTDWITDGQLRWLYEHATAYVFPSLSEGFGLPGLEAMHYDLPVISSNATCLPEVYGDAAAYFDPLNTQEMANTITKVLAGEQLRNNLVKNGQEQLKKYSWQHTAEQTLAVYEKALK